MKNTNEMDLKYKNQHQVYSFQVDFRKQMRPSSMVRIFQEAATNHAEQLGVGYEALMAEGIFWVLSKIEVNIIEPIFWEDVYTIETWPVVFEGLLFRRDFIFKKNDRIICEGSSGWLLVNEEKRRPVRPSNLKVDFPCITNEGVNKYFQQKIEVEHDKIEEIINVGYSDIDMNQHANNTRYFDWLLQCIPQKTLQAKQIKSITIEYLKEAEWGDTLDVKMDELESNSSSTINVEAINRANGKTCFRGRCILE
ncbi:thioesterase [Prolixibacteraceae bacterium]|nr:thioesterase [Prolixibacteraceae bacterium]